MTLNISPSVEQLFRDKMSTGQYASEDELLVEALQSLSESDKELKGIEEALASLRSGEKGGTVDEAFDRLYQRHGIADSP